MNQNTQILDIVNRYEVFNSLSQSELSYLSDSFKKKSVSRHQYIYRQKDTANSMFFLYEGSIKLGKMDRDGREAIKEVFHSPNMFGTAVIHEIGEREDFAQALNNKVTYYELKLSSFLYLLSVNHKFSLKIIDFLSKKLTARENRIAALMTHDARGRIIDFIKKSADERGRQVGLETLVKHSLTQQEIANMTGTSRQTVTHVLNDLKKSNLIYFNRKSILIRDIAQLV